MTIDIMHKLTEGRTQSFVFRLINNWFTSRGIYAWNVVKFYKPSEIFGFLKKVKLEMRIVLKTLILFFATIIACLVNFSLTFFYDWHSEVVLADSQSGMISLIGYKPVQDPPDYNQESMSQYMKDGEHLAADQNHSHLGQAGGHHNFPYKEWCEETFDNGNYIYDAYRNIAFHVKYTSEPKRIDFWQTPIETTRLKRGDCEDAVLLFFSQIPSNQKNAEIVWGWVIDKRSEVGKAHVWYQLTDKKGQKYIVEGFSKDWNGIIPIRIMQETETRKPILTISHGMVSKLSRLLPVVDEWRMCKALVDLFTSIDFLNRTSGNQYFSQDMSVMLHISELEFIGYSMNAQDEPGKNRQYQGLLSRRKETPRVNRETSNILGKLHEVFSRYENQKEEVGLTMRVSLK